MINIIDILKCCNVISFVLNILISSLREEKIERWKIEDIFAGTKLVLNKTIWDTFVIGSNAFCVAFRML